jgi:hypothetical protein
MTTKRQAASKRELIEPHRGDKRYVRRRADGTFGKTVDQGRSLSADKRRKAKAKVAKGQGDRGDIVAFCLSGCFRKAPHIGFRAETMI